ncbi:hypothetical protein CHUAL_014072 [Chamberlinius hualienensis]
MEEVIHTRLEIWDYVTMAVLILISSSVGIYHMFKARKSNDTKNFLVASKELGQIPLILSSVATFYSAIGILAYPTEPYLHGLSYGIIVLPVLLTAPIGSHFFLPVFYKLGTSTVFEYLEMRFCKAISIGASVLFSIQTLFYTSCVMYVPALAINQASGLHLWTSVITIGVICTIYTSLGGIKAVVWADCGQCLLMLTIVTLIIVKSATDIGGLSVIWDRLTAGNRNDVFIWTSSPHSRYSVWTMTIGVALRIISYVAVSQSLMQRYLSNKTLKSAQKSYLGSMVGVSIGYFLITLEGTLMFSYYHDCDPVLSGKVKFRDQSMALFAMEILSFCKGLAGVFVAGIMCATLSTLSSMLNSLSSVALIDYIKPLVPNMSDKTSIKIARLLVVFFGAVSVALVLFAQNAGGVAQVLYGIEGVTAGPVLAVFTMGMMLPWINSKGAIIGFLCSIILPTWAWIGNLLTQPHVSHAPLSIEGCSNWTAVENVTAIPVETNFLQHFYGVNAFWYDVWSMAIGLLSAIIASKVTGFQDLDKLDLDLLFPFVQKLLLKSRKANGVNNNSIEKVLDKGEIGIEHHVIQPLLMTNKPSES